MAHATIVPARHLNLDNMIADAGRIVRGKVLRKRTFWGQGKRHIYTEYTLQVNTALKGVLSKEVKIHILGGQIGQRISRVAGVAHFAIGEEVVVFLEPKRHKTYQFILGMTAGKFRVYRKANQVFLHRSLQGLAFQTPKNATPPKTAAVQEPKASETPLTWQRLQRRVGIVKRQRAIAKLRVLPTKQQLLRQRYWQLLRARQLRLQQQKLRPRKQSFGVLLPRRVNPRIGALPTLKTPKPTLKQPRGGK